jgi:hypothetical protein
MKKDKIEGQVTPQPLVGKRGKNRVKAELVDKATESSDFENIKEAEEFRPPNVDVVHRFGKTHGSK